MNVLDSVTVFPADIDAIANAPSFRERFRRMRAVTQWWVRRPGEPLCDLFLPPDHRTFGQTIGLRDLQIESRNLQCMAIWRRRWAHHQVRRLEARWDAANH